MVHYFLLHFFFLFLELQSFKINMSEILKKSWALHKMLAFLAFILSSIHAGIKMAKLI